MGCASRTVIEIRLGNRPTGQPHSEAVVRSDAVVPYWATNRRGNRRRKVAKLDADLLPHVEIDQLLRACSKRAPTGRRNRALIALLWRAGLRLGEALSLTPKDVDLQEFVVRIQHGKTGKRVVGLDSSTAALIEQWQVSRRELKISGRAPLFCTLDGGKIDQSYVRHLLPRLAAKAGIERRVHAHGLRHRMAIDLVQEGADLLTVRDLLGHASAATTQTYLSRIGASDAVDFGRQREWSLT
jgi:site-specific recombinase XerD